MNAKTNFQGWTIFPEITGTEILHPVEEPYISAVWIILHGGGANTAMQLFQSCTSNRIPPL